MAVINITPDSFFDGGTPTRQLLDSLVPDRPACLTNRDGHGVWANTRAIEVAGASVYVGGSFDTGTSSDWVLASAAVVGAVGLACFVGMPALKTLGHLNIVIFLIGFVVVSLAAGVPITFCFGIGALSYLAFTTTTPMGVMIGRMDEGMSSLVLVSVPVFVLLGCVLDATGMGKAIIDFLASLIGHVKGGMSYVLLGSLFIVSGISGSKVVGRARSASTARPASSL